MFTYISLFTGVGGFDLGFDRAGMVCLAQVEINKKAVTVLEHHWPNVKRYEDIHNVGKSNLPTPTVLCGGFPCQDASVSGKRKGFNGERSVLWHEYARIIHDLKPGWVVVENVEGLLSVNAGRDFGCILRDLASCGYDAKWQVLYASDFGAPHRRGRVYLVAHRDSKRIERFFEKPIPHISDFSWCEGIRRIEDFRERSNIPEPLIRKLDDGFSFGMDSMGNAVVPAIAEWIAQQVIESELAQLTK